MRSPATTSSISLTERSWPIASGVIDCGKTTVSFSGSTGSVAGIVALGRLAQVDPLRTTIVTRAGRATARFGDRQRDP